MEDLQNQNPQNDFNQTPQQNPKKQIPSWIGFVIIIAAIAILFGGVFAYQYLSKEPSEGSSRLISSECLKKNPNPPESNWCYQIYHNGQWVGVN